MSANRQIDPIKRLAVALPIPQTDAVRFDRELPGVEVAITDWPPPPGFFAGADAILAWGLEPDHLAECDALRWLQTGGAGVEHLPMQWLRDRDIMVTNGSGFHVPNMAEHTFAMILAFARCIPALIRAQIDGEWREREHHPHIFEVGGQRILLVGTGDIGQSIAVRAKAFDMHVDGVRRRKDQPALPDFDRMWAIADLHAALAEADHVVNSLPMTDATRNLFDAAAFAAMKPGARFYNLGRGGTVDTDALIAALRSGHVAAAGLDVTEPEPLPADSPLWDMEQVIITAHTAGATPNLWGRIVDLTVDNVRRWNAGDPLRNQVDLTLGY